MEMTRYIGNGAYCWSNATAMLLSSIGETITPSLIDVLGGVGLGAMVLRDSNVTFFSGFSGLPDKGISKALDILGFEYTETSSGENTEAPWVRLEKSLSNGPVILGPLDMGYLSYDPKYKNHGGIDHFVLAVESTNDIVRVHDPAGFPNVLIHRNDLAEAWKAEKIGYKRGWFRSWAYPSRINRPSEEEIYDSAIAWFKQLYKTGEKYAEKRNRIIDEEAIMHLTEKVRKDELKQDEWGMMTSFAFPLAARRSLDYAHFFSERDPRLADLKTQQSKLFGSCQTCAVKRDLKMLSSILDDVALLEANFKTELLK